MQKTPLLGFFALMICATTLLSCQRQSGPTASPSATVSPVSTLAAPPAPSEPGFVETKREGAPLSLTTADGTGLKLVELHAQAMLEGPLAFTQLHLTFENPEDRVLEGRFEITLPERAAISRFAMKIGDKWQEAEMVERQAARRAYEDFLHQRQDPALLEKEAGNEFRARIFPIPAKGRKEILISYSQELESSGAPYVLPLQGLPQIGNLLLEARAGAQKSGDLQPEIQAVRRKDFKPTGDFTVPQDGGVEGLAGGGYIVARVRPEVTSRASAVEDLLVLVDTSASRSLGFSDQVEMIAALVKDLPKLEKLKVAAFDQNVETLYEGKPADYSSQALLDRKALGATDLHAALKWAGAQKGHRRLLLITDGITTAGSEELGEALKASSLERLDVILVGGIRDKDRMEVLVADALSQDGTVLDSALPATELARKLSLSVTSGLDVSVEGAEWVWPSTLENIQPGDERLVYAQLEKPSTVAKISLGVSSAREVSLQNAVAVPLLSRSATVAQIARLESLRGEAKEAKDKERLAKEIIELSTQNRVLSDLTALLVLETEQDYRRFSIDRKALVDIMEMDDSGLVLTKRSDIAFPTAEKKVKGEGRVDNDGLRLGGSPSGAPSRHLNYNSHVGASAGTADEGGERFTPGSASDDGVVTQSLELRSESLAGSAPSDPSDYTNERESVNYRVAQAPIRSTAPGATTVPRAAGAPRRSAASSAEEVSEDADNAGYRGMVGRGSAAPKKGPSPLTGEMAEISGLLLKGKIDEALKKAWTWQQAEPGNVLALLALGDCLEARGELATAARVYGSIIDLFPSRADLRRFAGSRLQGLGKEGLPLAVDSFTEAVAQRPDHVSSHRFLAFGLARQERYEEAFAALEAGLKQSYPSGRFAGYQRILKEDLGLVGAAWAARKPDQSKTIQSRLQESFAQLATEPSLRFILTWETDANDVDFHIHDSKGGHAFYSSRSLPSGGELFDDVTTGYGPECFAIKGMPQAFPYQLQIHYYSRGPMGYGMGQLEVLQHDGKGSLLFEERPYVVMTDGAYVDLGMVKGPLTKS